MLPRRLMQIKSRIEAKYEPLRIAEEKELLAELKQLEIQIAKGTLEFSESITATRMTSGPSEKCACCGK